MILDTVLPRCLTGIVKKIQISAFERSAHRRDDPWTRCYPAAYWYPQNTTDALPECLLAKNPAGPRIS